MHTSSNKSIAIREIVKAWIDANAPDHKWTVNDNLSAAREVTITLVGFPPKTLPDDDQFSPGPLKREIEAWLRETLLKD
jgi:hypothetical protein